MNKGKIIVAGIGPGSEADITPAALAAIQSSDVIIGYKYYSVSSPTCFVRERNVSIRV